MGQECLKATSPHPHTLCLSVIWLSSQSCKDRGQVPGPGSQTFYLEFNTLFKPTTSNWLTSKAFPLSKASFANSSLSFVIASTFAWLSSFSEVDILNISSDFLCCSKEILKQNKWREIGKYVFYLHLVRVSSTKTSGVEQWNVNFRNE